MRVLTKKRTFVYDFVKNYLLHFFRKIGWNTNYNLELSIDQHLEHIVEAFVDMEDWVINFNIPPKFLQIFQELQDKYNLNRIYESTYLKNPSISLGQTPKTQPKFRFHKEIYNFLAGVCLHEFGHSKECPMNNENFSKILQAVSTCLEANEVFNQELLSYMINLFTDVIVNTIYGLDSQNSYFRNSTFTFYFSELTYFESADTSFYFFIILNLKLFQFHIPIRDALEDILLTKLPKDFKNKLEKLLEIFCPYKNIGEKLWVGTPPTENERWKIINHISDPSNWGKMAYDFTELLYEYVSEDLLDRHQTIPDSIFVKKLLEDEKFKKEILDRIIKRKIEESNKAEKVLSKEEGGSEKGKKESLDGMGEDYKDENNINAGINFFNDIEQLDALYQYRLKKMRVKYQSAETHEKKPITWLNRDMISENENPYNFDPLNVFYLPNSDEMLLYKKTVPYTGDNTGQVQKKGFPNLAFFCDDSGSMDWNPQTGDGKYDALIITVYSLLNWLRDKGFASVIKYHFSFFSSTTRSTGWMDYFNLDKKLKPLLFSHEGRGTRLKKEVFSSVVNDNEDKAILLITDGKIYNHKEIYSIIKNNKKHNSTILFIQIGKPSKLYKKLQKIGINVNLIKDITKLSEIVLNFLDNVYSVAEK
ncbi:MAG: hypothetical protein ACOC44_13465 [Promethearchaeia archaeon]